jgi:hypothetical protein
MADVAIAALTEDGHSGQVYELTGPRLLTFAEAVEHPTNCPGRLLSAHPCQARVAITARTQGSPYGTPLPLSDGMRASGNAPRRPSLRTTSSTPDWQCWISTNPRAAPEPIVRPQLTASRRAEGSKSWPATMLRSRRGAHSTDLTGAGSHAHRTEGLEHHVRPVKWRRAVPPLLAANGTAVGRGQRA